MLTDTDNAFLTRVGPGTSMGDLFRRSWLPVLLAEELPDPDGPPLRIRVLGEDLVAFRATNGQPAVVVQACPHRGASLFFGRNEEDGLRCVYHGWKFDANGDCVDMPNEPAESNFKHKIRLTAYPAAEWGGLIWAYLGPPELRPELPEIEWCTLPSDRVHVKRWPVQANYLQVLEGQLDSSHVSFLHRSMVREPSPRRATRGELITHDRSPALMVQETEYGMAYAARRTTPDGQYYWRITQLLLPTCSLIPSVDWPRNSELYVPADDEHTWAFGVYYDATEPLSNDMRAFFGSGRAAIPVVAPDTLEPLANKGNDYLLDRDAQRTRSFTGIVGTRTQDLAVVESMAPIAQRTREHLGAADIAIIAARRLLLRMARALQQGVEPPAATDGAVYRRRALDVVAATPSLGDLLQEHAGELMAEQETQL